MHVLIGLRKEGQQLYQHFPQPRLALSIHGPVVPPPIQQHLLHLDRGKRLVRQVKRDERRLHRQLLVPEHRRRCLRVDEDVELGILRPVPDPRYAVDGAHRRLGEPAAHGTAHDAQPRYVRHELWVIPEKGGDVGEGSRSDEPGCAGGFREEGVGHGARGGGGAVDPGLAGREEVGAIEAGLAVDVDGHVDGGAGERLVGAGVDSYFLVLANGREE